MFSQGYGAISGDCLIMALDLFPLPISEFTASLTSGLVMSVEADNSAWYYPDAQSSHRRMISVVPIRLVDLFSTHLPTNNSSTKHLLSTQTGPGINLSFFVFFFLYIQACLIFAITLWGMAHFRYEETKAQRDQGNLPKVTRTDSSK